MSTQTPQGFGRQLPTAFRIRQAVGAGPLELVTEEEPGAFAGAAIGGTSVQQPLRQLQAELVVLPGLQRFGRRFDGQILEAKLPGKPREAALALQLLFSLELPAKKKLQRFLFLAGQAQ